MWHPDEGTIHAWLDGALPNDERADVERHVASCAECSTIVAEARGLIAGASRIVSALDVVPGGVIPSAGATSAPIPSLSLWRALRITPARAAIAASLLVAASAVLVKRHDTPDKMVPHAPVVAVAEPTIEALPPVKARPAAAPLVQVPTPARDSAAPVPTVVAAAPVAPIAPVTEPVLRDRVSAAASVATAKAASTADAAPPPSAQLGFSVNRVLGLAANRAEAASNPFVGCYQVTADSTRRPEFVPARFALQLAPRSETTVQHVVRAVASDGRIDSVLAGSTWGVTTPMLANVSFASVSGRQQLSLTAGTNGSVAAFVVTDAERRSVPISRSTCVPAP